MPTSLSPNFEGYAAGPHLLVDDQVGAEHEGQFALPWPDAEGDVG
jgi:hypothetical protein